MKGNPTEQVKKQAKESSEIVETSQKFNRQRESPQVGRRSCLKAAGLAFAGGALSHGVPSFSIGSLVKDTRALPQHPNFLIVITDQERYPQHWPTEEGWYTNHFPARQRLARYGITFRQAYCNSAMCSPSRATLFTGLYSTQHQVKRTLTYGGAWSHTETPLPVCVQNMARVLAAADYRVVLAGKWHLSKSASGGPPSIEEVAPYGFTWLKANTAGEATEMKDFGGGCADNDSEIKKQALAFLDQESLAKTAERPFCLILSLANPHDVLSYPNTWDQESTEVPGCFNYKNSAGMFDMIDIPGKFADYLLNYNDDLSTKPSVQAQSMNLYAGLGTLQLEQKKKNYFNFYAYLQKTVDVHIHDVLNRLDSRGLTESTVVVRLSDHGEMGLSHGLRQKMFNVYEESIHVPLVFSNPILFPVAQVTDAFASLVDVLPTLAVLANVPDRGRYLFQGKDLTPVFQNPSSSVQDRLLYLFDDEYSGLADPPEPNYPIMQPNHIRCIRLKDKEGIWKYARYFDPAGTTAEQYEMYHVYHADGRADDLAELKNLSADGSYSSKKRELAQALANLEAERLQPWNGGCRIQLPLLQRI